VALAATLLAGGVFAGGWLWLRDSSLVAVRQVRIGGVRGPQAQQIEAVLANAARRMTTMDFDVGALRAAVASFPVVKEVRVATSFPHGVRVQAIERPPVATLTATGERTAVAADGTVLGAALLSSSLPLVGAPFVPLTGERLADPDALAAVALLGVCPPPLARFVTRVYSGPQGLTAAMRNGLIVYFGNATRPHAKWLSLARVLADGGSAGAVYVDVRVPERPAAGRQGIAGITSLPAGTPAQSSPQASGDEATTAVLAERLAATVGVGSEAASGGGSASGAGESSAASAPAHEGASAAERPSAASQATTTSAAPSESASAAPSGGASTGQAGG
jgi:cell division protein FtsQ